MNSKNKQLREEETSLLDISLSNGQIKANENLIEVEMFVQDADEMNWFKRNLIQVLRRFSLNNYFHGVIAVTLNILVVLTATPFRVLPE